MRYRLDVVAASVADVVRFAGGWMYDRVMAGWDVTVLLADDVDERPLRVLGVDTADLDSALALWAERPHPQTVAVAADLFASDDRVRRGVLGALEQGLTEVTLWGEHLPAELDDSVGPVAASPQRGRPCVQGPGVDGRTRSGRRRRRRDRDIPLRCDGDAVGRLGPRPRDLSCRERSSSEEFDKGLLEFRFGHYAISMSTLPTRFPSAT